MEEVGRIMHFCVLFVGLNDILKGQNEREMKTNVRKIVKMLRDLGKHVIIITLPPILHTNQSYNRSTVEFNMFFKSFKTQKHIGALTFH